MSNLSDFFSVEREEGLWTVRFRPLDFMVFQRLEATEAMFQLLAEVESKHVKVLRAHYPASSLSPAVVDQFWDEAGNATSVPGGRLDPPLPALVRHAGTAISRMLEQLRRITTLCITSFEGEIDFDLFGVLLVAHYRVCSEDTVIINRVLERDAGPGSAMFWLLTRYLGYAKANQLLMEGKSLSAHEALEMQLVNRVVNPADLETEAHAITQQFATKPAGALASLVRASRYLDENLSTYLERIGSGFGG